MDNQQDDVNDEGFDTDLGFDEPVAGGQNRKAALMKVGLIAAGAVVVIVGLLVITGGSSNAPTPTRVVEPPNVNVTTNPAPPTPEIAGRIAEENKKAEDLARKTGDSFVPIAINPSVSPVQTDVNLGDDETRRLAAMQEEYNRQRMAQNDQAANAMAQATEAARAQAVQSMSQSMSAYLGAANGSRQPNGMSEMDVGFTGFSDGLATDDYAADGAAAQLAAAAASAKMIIPAATVEYGQLMIEANTDAPGPVMAMIVSGPLSGARMLGQFQNTDEFLTISFTQVVTKDGRSLPIQAIALDPDTTLPGMVTEIDRRYFQRYILPAAAEFVSGVGEALAETQTSVSQTDSSTVSSSDDPDFDEAIAQGISESFDGLADAIEDSGRRTQPLLRIAAGTPIGILFTQPVMDQTAAEQQAAAGAAGLGDTAGLPNGLDPSSDTARLIRELIQAEQALKATGGQ